MGVLKEVFGLCDGSSPMLERNDDAANREPELRARRSTELGMPFEADQVDFEPGSRG